MINKTPTFFTTAIALTLFASNAFAVTTTSTNAATKPVDKVTELFGDPVIVKGKGIEIKRSELDSVLLNAKSAAAARGQNIPPQYISLVEQQLLARIIQVKLLLNSATDADRIAGKERAEKRLDALFKRAGSDEMLNLQLKTMGLTKDEFSAKIADEATAEVAAERSLNVTISDDEAKKYYEDHPSQFEEPEKMRASHILFATRDLTTGTPLSDEQKTAKRKQAEAALKRIRAGEDFAKIAAEFSDDPASKEKGGELPPLARGQMVPEFEAAAMSLNTNQISDVVTTAYGFHIIKLQEKLPARKLEYDKVADELKEALKQQAMLKKLPEYTTKLRKDANVEILDEKLILKEEPEPPAEPAALDKPAKAVEKKK